MLPKHDYIYEIILDLVGGKDNIGMLLPIKAVHPIRRKSYTYEPHEDFDDSGVITALTLEHLDKSEQQDNLIHQKRDIVFHHTDEEIGDEGQKGGNKLLFAKWKVDDNAEDGDLKALNNCIILYNTWVKAENEKTRELVVSKVPVDDGGDITFGDLNEVWATIDRENYTPMERPNVWGLEVQC